MSQAGFTPIKIYSSSTTTNVPLAANLINDTSGSELAINIADGKLFYKTSGGVVQIIASAANLGDVLGPASATANAIPTFDGTTGKLIKNNSGVTITSGVVTATGFLGTLNGTVGGVTPAAGAFTTLSTTSTITLNGSTGVVGQPLISGGAGASGTIQVFEFSC